MRVCLQGNFHYKRLWIVVLSWYQWNCNPVVPRKYVTRVLCLCHRRICLEKFLYLWCSWWWSMCKTVSNWYLWCKFLEYWLLFVTLWVLSVVIMTLHKLQMLRTVSSLHMIPFTGRGSTWHPLMIFNCFLVLSCLCLIYYYGWMSLPRVVYVLRVVAQDFCK